MCERDHIFNLTHENFSFVLKSPLSLLKQIQQWEQNLEKFHMDLFRMRCYLASLQGGELPNPKSLLAAASRPSKLALGRLGILSVSSFHALVRSRGWPFPWGSGRTAEAHLPPAGCHSPLLRLTPALSRSQAWGVHSGVSASLLLI